MDNPVLKAEKNIKSILAKWDFDQLFDLLVTVEFEVLDEIVYSVIREVAEECGYCPECAVQTFELNHLLFEDEDAWCDCCNFRSKQKGDDV